jgi:anti-anti-sigma regulatory factor
MESSSDHGITADMNERLLAVSQAIAGAPDEKTIASALLGVMASSSVDSCHVWRFRGGAPEPFLEVVVAWDRSGEPSPGVGHQAPRSSFPSLDAITPERPLIEPGGKGAGDPRAFFPMVERGQVFGVLEVKSRPEKGLEPSEVGFFRSLAQVAAMALLHADSKAKLRRKLKQLKGLYEIAEILSEITDPKAIIKTTANLLVAKIGYLNAYVMTVDEPSNRLREAAMAGLGDYEGRSPSEYPLDAPDATMVNAFRAARPLAVDDIQRRADAEGWGELARLAGMRSAGYVPLRAGSKIIGVLGVGSTDARISDDELSLLGAFGNQIASTIARVEMNLERDKQLTELERANANLARLLETVRDLSTPVIPVHDGVLVLPIVGTIDTSRSAQIMESLLNAIQKERASIVIIDITGVPTVDTGVADHLLRSTRAASLLGARCVLVGVAPAVAQTLALLHIDFGDLVTLSNLQAGIAYALAHLSRRA